MLLAAASHLPSAESARLRGSRGAAQRSLTLPEAQSTRTTSSCPASATKRLLPSRANTTPRGKAPTEINEVEVPAAGLSDGRMSAFKLLVAVKLADSNNKARQLIQGGGVTLGEEQVKVTDPNQAIPITSGLLVRAGRHWAKVRLV